MRKQNSDFQTSFISEEGSQLKNNDYFAYVELDEYACYVIADGITDTAEAKGARLAIETIITNFQAHPSMSKYTLKKCLQAANQVLLRKDSYKRWKTSVTVVITDYQKMRYGYAGNTRLRMYRNGIAYQQTMDMSLAQEMAEQDKIARDQIEKHEERNNLYCYLGQKRFHPYISKKIKLIETDIITLYTRGIWENVDEAELDDVFSEAENEAQKSVDEVEELLLSRQPKNLENYTLAAIFINKIYQDPQKAKKRKKIIIITLIIILLIVILGIVLFIFHRKKQQNIEDMNYYFTNTIEYVNMGNYVHAKEECEKAQELSEKLHDNEMRQRLQEYLVVIETVLLADESYSEKDYLGAQEYFLTSLDRARFADNIGTEYIEKRLDILSELLSVEEYLQMGDTLLEHKNYNAAEEKYMLAKSAAANVHDQDGKEKAMEALEKLYQEWSKSLEAEQQDAAQQAGEESSAAELVASGDKACMEKDFAGARVFYELAYQKYVELEDEASQQMTQSKLEIVEQKVIEEEETKAAAVGYENQGALYQGVGDYWAAKAQYLLARNLYQKLGSSGDVERVSSIITQLDTSINQAIAAEQARQEAEAQARQEAEEQAKQEAEEQAKQETEEVGQVEEEQATTVQGEN